MVVCRQEIEDQAEQVFNASEKDNEHEKEDAVESAGQELVDVAQHDDADDNDEDDNLPLSSRIEALRRGNATDEDNVVLSQMYPASQQGLNPVEVDLEVVGVHDGEM
ncbi:hypothetical protein Dimus_024539 [Dionaea muscipula]